MSTIVHLRNKYASTYSPQENGVAERAIRSINECMLALLADSGLKKSWWGNALLHAVHVLNCLSSTGEASPYELVNRSKPPPANASEPSSLVQQQENPPSPPASSSIPLLLAPDAPAVTPPPPPARATVSPPTGSVTSPSTTLQHAATPRIFGSRLWCFRAGAFYTQAGHDWARCPSLAAGL